MKCFNQICRWSWAFLVAVTLVIGLGGCEGDDGAAGAPGANGAAGAAGADGADGADGTDGLDCWDLNGNGVGDPDEDLNNDGVFDANDCGVNLAKVTPLESCGVCHDDGSFADASAFHALDPIEFVDNIGIALVAGTDDLEVTFDLARDGVPTAGYDTIERAYRTEGTTQTSFVDSVGDLVDLGGGSYSFIIPDGNLVAGNNRYVFRVAAGDDRETRVYFYEDYPASPFDGPVAVTAEACGACHGPEGIGIHGGYFQAEDGGEPCLVCHGVFGFGRDIPSLGKVAHGLHAGILEEDGEIIEVTYPTYMTNCSVCHADADQLAAANAMTVSGENCFTCHGSIESWDFVALNLGFHLDIPDPETADCTLCHKDAADGGIAAANVAEMHNGVRTGRGGIIWDGVDTSVTEGAKFDWQVTGVVDDGTDLTITWQASYEGAGVNPCNATVGPGAPVFFVDNRLRVYRNYAQGDDFILGQSTSSPGQALNVDVTVDNTTCAGNVATTVIPADDVDAEKGRLALGGRPLVVSVEDPAESMAVRVPSPTYDWLVGDGAAAPMRRNVVNTEQCLGCHVGSLYQHGGDRIDNVDHCVLCHNSASNEKNVRVGMGVDASEAYDGKVGETFEMKTMLHRVHSSNYDWNPDRDIEEYNPPYLVYRGRGIYAFAHDESAVPNWDVVSTEGCTDDEIAAGRRRVFGSDPDGSDICEAHNFEAPTYPRSLNECTACHTEDFMVIPDQTKSMAATTDAGSDTWNNQLDDVLQGAATTACITCHADSASKGHAYQNSWTPQVFPEGRQTIIDAVN